VLIRFERLHKPERIVQNTPSWWVLPAISRVGSCWYYQRDQYNKRPKLHYVLTNSVPGTTKRPWDCPDEPVRSDSIVHQAFVQMMRMMLHFELRTMMNDQCDV
jgi:hypothetical protein